MPSPDCQRLGKSNFKLSRDIWTAMILDIIRLFSFEASGGHWAIARNDGVWNRVVMQVLVYRESGKFSRDLVLASVRSSYFSNKVEVKELSLATDCLCKTPLLVELNSR